MLVDNHTQLSLDARCQVLWGDRLHPWFSSLQVQVLFCVDMEHVKWSQECSQQLVVLVMGCDVGPAPIC